MKYTVEITETLQRKIEVEAESCGEAVNEVMTRYRNGEIVLTADDYVETLYNCFEPTHPLARKGLNRNE